jgi:hypothetical protein
MRLAPSGGGELRQVGLAAPHRGRRQFLVHAGHEGDVVLLQNLGHSGEHPVDATERAALVARHERRDAQPRARVALVLFDERARDCLHAGQDHGAGSRAIAIAKVVGLLVWSANVEVCHATHHFCVLAGLRRYGCWTGGRTASPSQPAPRILSKRCQFK